MITSQNHSINLFLKIKDRDIFRERMKITGWILREIWKIIKILVWTIWKKKKKGSGGKIGNRYKIMIIKLILSKQNKRNLYTIKYLNKVNDASEFAGFIWFNFGRTLLKFNDFFCLLILRVYFFNCFLSKKWK